MSLNKATITGQILEVSEIRYTTSNEPILNFLVDLGNKSKLKLVCWRVLAEKAKELSIGDTILASGSLLTSSFKTPSGFTRKDFELNVRDIYLLQGELKNLNPITSQFNSKFENKTNVKAKNNNEEDLSDVLNDDEIPF